MTLQWGRRFSSAEIGDTAAVIHAVKTLQWGRRFSSAEMLPDGFFEEATLELQWGRRFSSAEMDAVVDAMNFADNASMGPPIFIGGN